MTYGDNLYTELVFTAIHDLYEAYDLLGASALEKCVSVIVWIDL